MAFSLNRWSRQTLAFNTGKVTLADASIIEGPAMFTYASAGDAIATIAAANYFSAVAFDLAVGDYIFATGSDASSMYLVAAVDRTVSPATISLDSFAASGTVGTANITNLAVTTGKIDDLAVTTGKIAANAVTSAKMDDTLLHYVAVPITAAQFNGAYAAPVELVAAGGADTLLVLDKVQLLMTYGTAAFAAGGVAHIQYDATANGAGVIASTTLAAATFQATASTGWNFNAGVVAETFTTCVNKNLSLSNVTGAFTTGDSDMVAHVWYKKVATV